MGNPDKSAGLMRKAIRLWTGLEQAYGRSPASWAAPWNTCAIAPCLRFAVSRARAQGGLVTKSDRGLHLTGGTCESWSKKETWRRCCQAVRSMSASQSKRGELGSATSHAVAPKTQCNSQELESPWVDCSIKVSGVGTSHKLDRKAALGACRAIWPPSRIFFVILRRNCVSAADTSGSGVSLCSDQRLLQKEVVLLLEAKKAAGRVEDRGL